MSGGKNAPADSGCPDRRSSSSAPQPGCTRQTDVQSVLCPRQPQARCVSDSCSHRVVEEFARGHLSIRDARQKSVHVFKR